IARTTRFVYGKSPVMSIHVFLCVMGSSASPRQLPAASLGNAHRYIPLPSVPAKMREVLSAGVVTTASARIIESAGTAPGWNHPGGEKLLGLEPGEVIW